MSDKTALSAFAEIRALIQSSRQKALQTVNTTLIDLYWQIGAYISQKLESSVWGDGVVEQLAKYLTITEPGLRGFTRPNLFGMRQFYDAYRETPIVSALLRQLPWTHNLIILGQSKRPEEREFYLRMAIKEGWSSRELERQFKTALFERTVLHPAKVSPTVKQLHHDALSVFRDAYVVEFLGLLDTHLEADLHRGLNCLVAIELKVGRFEPEYLGKLSFYLEGLDRDHRKPHENPAIGMLLCASKDDEVVEYSLSRTLSPALIAEYQTTLPDKQLLQAKLLEFYELEAKE